MISCNRFKFYMSMKDYVLESLEEKLKNDATSLGEKLALLEKLRET